MSTRPSADTIVPNPTNPQAFNRYSYVSNNPLNRTDPTGHQECEDMPWECTDEEWSDDGTRPPDPPANGPILPTEKPDGLSSAGETAWNSFQEIIQVGGWWGYKLDAEEALILLLNHELLYEAYNTFPRDVIINQFNRYCSEGVWSTTCFNNFWGYSSQIRENKVCCNGGEREPDMALFINTL